MFSRVLLLIAVFCGLSAGPVCPAGACVKMGCGACCGDAGGDCCASAAGEVPESPTAVAVPSAVLKQAIVPVLICLGTQPDLVVPSVSIQERASARQPVWRRLDVTCIRLI